MADGGRQYTMPMMESRVVPPQVFADDMLLLSLTLEGLQCQMNFLAEYSDRNGLTVNVAKTKPLVFYSGGQCPGLKNSIDSHFSSGRGHSGRLVEEVDFSKYLGIVFHG